LLGDWRDVDIAVKHIRTRYPKRHLAIIGFSAGCFPLLRYLGEKGTEAAIDAAVCISGGVRLQDALDNCSFLFTQLFLYKAKQYFLSNNEDILRKHNSPAFDQALASYSSENFMRACAPFMTDSGKWCDVEKLLDPFPHMDNIARPVLFLNSQDDPVIGSVEKYSEQVFQRNKNLLLAVSATGSHCPFLDGCFSPEDYSMTTSLEFIAHQVQHTSLRKNALAAANVSKLRAFFDTLFVQSDTKESPRTSSLRKRRKQLHVPLASLKQNMPLLSVGTGMHN
jgi:predicted alpha/beta-fold hydrolase